MFMSSRNFSLPFQLLGGHLRDTSVAGSHAASCIRGFMLSLKLLTRNWAATADAVVLAGSD